jgi:hypothetical protein
MVAGIRLAGEGSEPAEVSSVERGHVGDEVLHGPRAAGNGAGQLLLGQRAGEALELGAITPEPNVL